MRRSLLVVLIAAFVVTSALYSVFMPIFEAQDEEGHFRFIRHFATRMSLPDFRKISDLESAGYQSHHTPLYYFFQGALLRLSGYGQMTFHFEENPFKSAGTPGLYYHNRSGERLPYEGKYRVIHLLRLTNIVAGVLTLLVVYRTARLMPFQEQSLPILAAAFIGLIPQFTYICGTLSNDTFSALFASLTILFLMKFLLGPNASGKDAMLMSVSLGLAIMSKQITLSLVPVCCLAVLVKGGTREKLRNALRVVVVLSLLVGWYYVRNWVLFRDPFTIRIQMEELYPILVHKMTPAQFCYYFSDYFIRIFINSFWGSFGYLQVWMHWNTYLFYNVIAGTGLLVFGIGMMDHDFRSRFSREQKMGLAFLLGVLFLLFAQIISYNLSVPTPQGRFGFSGLCALAVFWGLGMDRIIRGRERHRTLFSFFLVILFFLVNLHVVNTTLRRSYPPTPSVIDVVQNQYQAPLGEIRSDTVVGQSFRCNIDNLDQVAIRFTTFGRHNNCHVTFHLRDDSDMARDLVTIRLRAILLRNDTFHFFKFPPQRDSRGRRYLFLIESRDGAEGDAVSCLHTMFDSYDGGRAFVNGSPLPGDITFITGST